MTHSTKTYSLYDYGDRRDPVPQTPDLVATRKYEDQIARLGIRYRAAQPYEPRLVVRIPSGAFLDFDEWLGTIDAPIAITAALVEGVDDEQ